MDFLKRLGSLFSSSGTKKPSVFWVAVRCSKCGEILKARVNMWNDLSADYDDGKTTYFTRKVLIGEQGCYQPVEVELVFNDRRSLVNYEVHGGEWVDEEAVAA
jgi:hypothetical protein